jgi:hypothetical protein
VAAITLPYRLLQFTVPVECALLPGNACAIASDAEYRIAQRPRRRADFSPPIIHASDRP